MKQEAILEEYYGQNAGKLRHIVDGILKRFGGIAQMDLDDFYSLANEVFADVLTRYDGKQSFDGFLYSCLQNKICSEVTRRNRKKRGLGVREISLDAACCGDGNGPEDLLVSDFDVEREVQQRLDLCMDRRLADYMERLSRLQRRILALRMEEYSAREIMQRLGITGKEYEANMAQMRSFEYTAALRGTKAVQGREEKKIAVAGISGNSKNTTYAVASLIKKLDVCAIRGDYSMQRNSGQWSALTRSEYICALLHGYPVPAIVLAEQLTGKGTVNWLIDGKQRTANASLFEKNGFRISRNVERPLVSYRRICRDREGQIMFDRYGTVEYERREFDVRGRYYDDLPEELQERFLDYAFPVVQYLNCSDADIEYHIRRYNAAKPMSAAQKGITRLGEEFAGVVRELTKHPFFKNHGNYHVSEFLNGTAERVVMESMMAVYFLPDWKKRQEDMCRYLKDHAELKQFLQFKRMLDTLSGAVTEETAAMFTSRDSFLWFGLFAGLLKRGYSAAEFIGFLREFKRKLHKRSVGGVTFDELNAKSTKDRNVVLCKMKLLERLTEYFISPAKVSVQPPRD